MKYRTSLSRAGSFRPFFLACATACIVGGIAAGQAHAQLMLVGIDNKFAAPGGKRQALAPGRDSVLLFDLKDPSKPALIGQLPLENSIVGPPTNLAITPDRKLALVANAMHSKPAADGVGFVAVPAEEVAVLDLTSNPISVIGLVKVDAQPSGLAIDRSGKFALVASRAAKSITRLSIEGKQVAVTDTLPLADTVTAVAITPDCRHALATKFLAHKVAQLSISPDGKLTDDKNDLPVGQNPWNVAITPDGTRAIVVSLGGDGASDGNADSVTIIDLASAPPRVVQHVTVGDAPEGLAISPRGDRAVVTLLQGSYDAPAGAWFANPTGAAVMLKLDGNGISVASKQKVGSLPESAGFSDDGRYIYVGNFADSSLSILSVDADGILTARGEVALPGPPASLRVLGQ